MAQGLFNFKECERLFTSVVRPALRDSLAMEKRP